MQKFSEWVLFFYRYKYFYFLSCWIMKKTALFMTLIAWLLFSSFTTISMYASGNGGVYTPIPLPTPGVTTTVTSTGVIVVNPGYVVEVTLRRILEIPPARPTWNSTPTTTPTTNNNNEEVIMSSVLPQTGVDVALRMIKLLNTPHTPSK